MKLICTPMQVTCSTSESMDVTIESVYIWLQKRDWDAAELMRLIELCGLIVICDGKPNTKLATLPLMLQEHIVTKIGRYWPQMSRTEQDLVRALYNKSYRYNDAVSSTLRLYALHWCDTAAQGNATHTPLAVLTALVTLARTLAADRHRAVSNRLREYKSASDHVTVEDAASGSVVIDEEMDDSDVEWHRLVYEQDSVNESHTVDSSASHMTDLEDDTLDANTMARLDELKDTCQTEDSADWSILREISSPAKLSKACDVLELSRQSDEVVSRALNAVLVSDVNVSYVRCRALVDHVLTPRITQLQFPASRTLLALLISLARLHPKPFLDAVLVPLALNPASGTIQFEIIQRTTRDALPAEENISFLSTLLSSAMQWSELTVQLLHHFLNSKLEFDTSLFDMLVAQLQRQVTCLASSPKFSAFLFALITKYPAPSRQHAEIFRQILHKCQGWMVNKALTKLDEVTK